METFRIDDINDSRVELFTKYNEAQLYHYFEPNGGVFIAETPEVIKRALDRGAEPIAFLVEEKAFESQVVKKLLDGFDDSVQVFVSLRVFFSVSEFSCGCLSGGLKVWVCVFT